MFETVVLTVLEKVLSQYITDVITKRRTERTRAEVIEAVKVEISRMGAIEKQVDALTIAVRELDSVVRDDKYLRWQDDILAVEPIRRGITKRPNNIEAAITQLHESIARRRRELAQSSAHEEADEVRLVEVGDEGSGEPPGAPQKLSSWQEKIMGLQSDVRRERRQARDK